MLFVREKFTVYTEHRALKWLLNLQDPSSRLTRWALKLSEYDFQVGHRSSTKMRHADALSRCVGTINQEVALTRNVIREEQLQDRLCNQYRHCYGRGWVRRGTDSFPPRLLPSGVPQ